MQVMQEYSIEYRGIESNMRVVPEYLYRASTQQGTQHDVLSNQRELILSSYLYDPTQFYHVKTPRDQI
jgi:hypothetical protein